MSINCAFYVITDFTGDHMLASDKEKKCEDTFLFSFQVHKTIANYVFKDEYP